MTRDQINRLGCGDEVEHEGNAGVVVDTTHCRTAIKIEWTLRKNRKKAVAVYGSNDQTLNEAVLVRKVPVLPQTAAEDIHPADGWINGVYLKGRVNGLRHALREAWSAGVAHGRQQIEKEIAGELLGNAQENGR
jgi:hypothetical protein